MQFLPGDLANLISNYFYPLIIVVVFQGALVLVLFVLFLDKFLSSKPKRVQDEVIKQDAYKQARELLQDAQTKAEELINETTLFTDSFKKSIETNVTDLFASYKTEISKLSNDILNNYKKSLEDKKSTTLTSFTSVSEDIKKQTLDEIRNISKDTRQSMLDAQGVLRNEMEGDLKDIRTRLKAYEELRMRKMDERIFEILTMVSKEALGRIMTISDHQDLVLKTLEDAKAQNLF